MDSGQWLKIFHNTNKMNPTAHHNSNRWQNHYFKISFQPAVLDKLAHSMLHARHNYHRILLKYVSALRDIHTLKKVFV